MYFIHMFVFEISKEVNNNCDVVEHYAIYS